MPQEVERAQHRVAHRAMVMQHDPDPGQDHTKVSPTDVNECAPSFAAAAHGPS